MTHNLQMHTCYTQNTQALDWLECHLILTKEQAAEAQAKAAALQARAERAARKFVQSMSLNARGKC